MGKWLSSKQLKTDGHITLEVKEGVNSFRINMNDMYYYISASSETREHFGNNDGEFFLSKINDIKTKSPGRKETRANNRYYKKMMKKVNKNKSNIIKEEKINNDSSSIDEVKDAVVDNLKNVIVGNKEKDDE